MVNNALRAQMVALAKKGVSHIRLTEEEWSILHKAKAAGSRFSLIFPHEVAKIAKSGQLCIFSINGGGLRVGLASSIQAVATLDSRILFDLVAPVNPGDLTEVSQLLAKANKGLPMRRMLEGEDRIYPLSDKLRVALIYLLTSDASNESALRLIASRTKRPAKFDGVPALQSDALNLALKAFGATDAAIEASFGKGYTAIQGARLLEDAVIEHDARWAPGWSLNDSDVTGRAVFVQRDEKLTVYTANKRPLEKLLGVDLIYLNERKSSLIMVQYKMMEATITTPVDTNDTDDILRGGCNDSLLFDSAGRSEAKEWAAPIDHQFRAEIDRMLVFDNDLSPDGSYRLNPEAFYFKFVRRNAAINAPAVVLSLGHLTKLISEGSASGPRGGLRVSYAGLDGHYIRNDGFIELIRSGYIGSRDATTEHLRTLIETALQNDRGVVAAIQSSIS